MAPSPGQGSDEPENHEKATARHGLKPFGGMHPKMICVQDHGIKKL